MYVPKLPCVFIYLLYAIFILFLTLLLIAMIAASIWTHTLSTCYLLFLFVLPSCHAKSGLCLLVVYLTVDCKMKKKTNFLLFFLLHVIDGLVQTI